MRSFQQDAEPGHHRLSGAPFLVALAGLGGVGCTGPTDCTAIDLPEAVVMVEDSLDGTPQAAGARGAVERGAYRDSLRPFQVRGLPPHDTLLSLQGRSSSSGFYRITVQKDGYRPWMATGVRLTQSVCHNTSTTLTARLQR